MSNFRVTWVRTNEARSWALAAFFGGVFAGMLILSIVLVIPA